MAAYRIFDPYDREVGLRIRSLRKSQRMSQTDLADRLGLTFQQVQKYEKGSNRVSAGRLRRIAEIFEVPVSALFGDYKGGGEATKDPLAHLRVPGAVDLLEAYSRIQDRELRRILVQLAERIVLASQRSSRD